MSSMSSEPRAHGRWRSLAAALLIVLGVLCIAVGMVTAWLRTQVLDTDEWVATSRTVIEDPAIQTAVATWTVDQLFDRVQPEDMLDSVLPKGTEFLSGPLVSRVRVESYDVAERALAEPRVQNAWATVNRRAHERLKRAIEGHEPIVVKGPGGVLLDLRPVLEQVAQYIGVSESVVDAIPQKITTVQPKHPERIERGLRALRVLDRWGAIVSCVALPLLLLGVWLAGDRRRAWIWIGMLLALASWGIGYACGAFGPVLSGVMTQTTTWRAAIETTWDAISDLLRDSSRAGIVVGLLAALVAWSAGGASFLVRARRAAAPILVDRRPLALCLAAALAWLVISIVPALDGIRVGMKLVLAALAVGAAWWIAAIATRERNEIAGVEHDG